MAVKDVENIAIDFAESQLHQQILDGNSTATIFFLKTKGKKRGYVERTEVAHDIQTISDRMTFNFVSCDEDKQNEK